MLIKVCGIADAGNAMEVASLNADMMGFIFYRQSPRNAFGLSPQVVGALPPDIVKTGVFVDESPDIILQTVEIYGLDAVQLHGSEPPELCRDLKGGVKTVLKAFGIATAGDLRQTDRYQGACDMFVFDTKTLLKGGSGRKFDHSLLRHYRGTVPYLLSGGIGPGDTGITSALSPLCAGVDLNSRFETSPGVKDIPLLKTFIREIRKNEKKDEQNRQIIPD